MGDPRGPHGRSRGARHAAGEPLAARVPGGASVRAVGRAAITLVGDGIENPANAPTMLHAAEMFGVSCLFRDRKGLAAGWSGETLLPLVGRQALAEDYRPIVACDNLQGATDVYSYRLPAGERPALVLGNERHGIAEDLRTLADGAVEIPMVSRRINCLNVAAAAAVALYYQTSRRPARLLIRSAPERRRPTLLLLGADDHVELGSSIRSAAAFGWQMALIDDRAGAWFGADRGTRTEGRAAARRSRNAIRLVPSSPEQHYAFTRAVVVTTSGEGTPLRKVDLAGGPNQVLVVPDESALSIEQEDWSRLARTTCFARLELPTHAFTYHYRLVASIALAEAARQIGRPTDRRGARPPSGRLRYERLLKLLPEQPGEVVLLEDLLGY